MHPARLHLEALHGLDGDTLLAPEGQATETFASRAPASNRICVANTRNILVVDDNDRHLDILNTILTSIGHNVEPCGSGAEALRRLSCRRYDLVVLDLVMPEISGAVVASQMRDGGLNTRTPVVVCTANVIIARRELGQLSGVTAIIGKPIDAASLILAVARSPLRERRPETVRH